jgi:hypothetical protein
LERHPHWSHRREVRAPEGCVSHDVAISFSE